MLEIIAPSARAARLREPFSAQLRANRARHLERVRTELEELFPRELEVAGAGRAELLDALTVAATWGTWSVLRDELCMSVDQAQSVVARTVTALLAADLAASLHRPA